MSSFLNRSTSSMGSSALPIASLSQLDKKIIVIGLITVAAIGWLYMFYMAWAMENMHLVDMWMPPRNDIRPWTAADFLMLFLMWLTMMLAMMTPTATPMVLMFATVNKQKKLKHHPYVPTFIFLTGYLVAWCISVLLHRLFNGHYTRVVYLIL